MTNRILDYTIVREVTVEKLAKQVNMRLMDGYVPQGGLVHVVSGYSNIYGKESFAQAMVMIEQKID
jgi:hypothetical protein